MPDVRPMSCPCRALGDVHNMTIIPDHNDDGVGLLRASLIGRRREVQLTTIPFTRHQGVVLDDETLKRRHVALAGFKRRGEHSLILSGRIVLRYSRGCWAIESCRAATERRVTAISGL